jgi:hypothetical protein
MRRINLRAKWLPLLFTLALVLPFAGCTASSVTNERTGMKFTSGKMFHVKQVLEHYDAGGNPVPQYFELWLTSSKGRCSELDAEGNEISVSLDTGDKHLTYDTATLAARETGDSTIFILNFSAMKKVYPDKQYSEEGQYADRDCVFHLMGNDSSEGWIKIYLDKETGYTLYCDGETFRLRTALFEEIPADEGLFAEPEGLTYKGGSAS